MSQALTTGVEPSPNDASAVAWAASGAMWLSGRAGGRPLLAPGDPARLVERHLASYLKAVAVRDAHLQSRDAARFGARLLGERAALAGQSRNAPWSAGGGFRTVRTADGWLGLSLAREDDIALLPALVEAPVTDPWVALAAWARRGTSEEAMERVRLLGLPGASWPPAESTRPAVLRRPGARRRMPERPVVMDLSALWAGPLCAHLLGLAGCRVVKVESTRRLDGARHGPPAFYDLLHAGHESVTLDFSDPAERQRLADLLLQADLVVEAARPRALEALGIKATEYVDQGITWLSITARGRASGTVGFGDDVAVAAGLAAFDRDELVPIGDALADPLTGVAAAAAAAEALLREEACLLDVSMLDVSRAAVGARPDVKVVKWGEDWCVETAAGRQRVAAPVARAARRRAAAPGADNEVWLQ